VAGKLVQSIESTWRRRKSSLLNRKILDIEDEESSRTARLAKEHDAKDFGIRSLRRASFFLDQENGLSIPTIVMESFIDVAFAIDLCTNFCTTYMDEHQHIEINNSKKMAIHYLQGFFWIDLLATVPFELIFGSVVTSLGWLGALKMVRLLRLGRLVKKLDDVTGKKWQCRKQIRFYFFIFIAGL